MIRSKILTTHPILVEFLKTDHFKIDEKFGLKDFSKRLNFEEQELNKKSGFFSKEIVKNGIYRVAATQDPYDVTSDFEEKLFDRNPTSTLFQTNILNEQIFIQQYERTVANLLAILPKFEAKL